MKPTFTRSIDAQILADMLAKLNEGDELSYQKLSDAIKRDVTRTGRGALRTAIHAVLVENQIVIGIVRRQGVKRLTNNEAVGFAAESVAKIHRESKRGFKRIASVDYAKLDQSQQLKHNATAAILAALQEGTTTRRVKLVENAVKDKNKLAVAETLAALAGK